MRITKNIYYIGVNDRTKPRFEALWPIPKGVSYNSYLITDKKNTLIDTVDACYFGQYLSNIQTILGDAPIHYLIVNHMEPDHAGSISLIRQAYPDIQIVGNKKTIEFLNGFHGITENLLEVSDGDHIALGETHLSFHLTPMVHWPEVMMTHVKECGVLFSADAFGCYGTLDGGVIDTQMHTEHYWDEMYRYYANIVGKYGNPVQKALQKLRNLNIEYICSTHGPVWHEQKERALCLYDRLSRYEGEDGLVVAYGSMYGHTEQMAEAVGHGAASAGLKRVILHNLSKSEMSVVLSDVFRYKGLALGSPTYCNELFPEVKSLIDKLDTRDLKNRTFGYFGSYSWAGAACKQLAAFAEKMKWEVVGSPVENKQAPSADIINACRELGYTLGKRILEQQI